MNILILRIITTILVLILFGLFIANKINSIIFLIIIVLLMITFFVLSNKYKKLKK